MAVLGVGNFTIATVAGPCPDILSHEMNLPKNISKDLRDLFRLMAADFPAIVRENLVGISLWVL